MIAGNGKKAEGSMAITNPATDSTNAVMDFRRVHIIAPATQSWFDDLNKGAMDYALVTKAIKPQLT